MPRSIWILVSVLSALPVLPHEVQAVSSPDEPNRVIVPGRRPDQIRIEYPGSGWSFLPSGGSQDELDAHVKRSASFSVLPADHPAPFGFHAPRIRAQEARFTRIFVGDVPLSDPWASLPLAEELDLPAFNSVDVTAGAAPFNLPAVASQGAVSFRLFPADHSDVEGDVRVPATWSLSSRVGEPQGHASSVKREDAFSRLYFRQSNYRGNYRFYDDGGTPLNREDDGVTRRINNHRASRFFMPAGRWRLGNSTIESFAIWNESRQGIAPIMQRSAEPEALRAAASQQTRLALGRVSVAMPLSGVDGESQAVRDELRASLTALRDEREVDDPDGQVLILPGHDKRQIFSRNASIEWVGGSCLFRTAECRVSFFGERADVLVDGFWPEQEFDQLSAEVSQRKFGRDGLRGLFAARWKNLGYLPGNIEAKVEGGVLRDTHGGVLSSDPVTRPAGWSLGWHHVYLQWIRPWLQHARESRPPGLMMTHGDGGRIHASAGLVPERIDHSEAGVDFGSDALGWNSHFAVFRDVRKDAIVIVPSSVSSYRARNLDQTSQTQGIECEIGGALPLAAAGATRASLSWVFFQSDSGAGGSERLAIPGVPADEGAIAIAQPLWRRPWRMVTGRWTSRRRGVVYRDVANDIESPAWWVHDAAVDFRWQPSHSSHGSFNLVGGIAVTNVLDRMWIESSTAAGTRRTGYSDVWGVPLPGRSWQFSLTMEF
jgi:hypothetical protein